MTDQTQAQSDAVLLPPPQPQAVQTMAAQPQVLAEMFNTVHSIQEARFRGILKALLAGAAVAGAGLATVWALEVLGVVRENDVLVAKTAVGLLSVLLALLYGAPDWLSAQEMLAVVPQVKARLWYDLEVALNALGANVDLNQDGVVSRPGSPPVHYYNAALADDEPEEEQLKRTESDCMLAPPLSGYTYRQVMEFLKLGKVKGFARDRFWVRPNASRVVLLENSVERLVVTRRVYEDLVRGLQELGILVMDTRWNGLKMQGRLLDAHRKLSEYIIKD